MTEAIAEFMGEYRFLSNFHFVPVMFDGVEYPTTEHAYQAAKTLSPDERQKIRAAAKPGEARRLGQKVVMRPDWEEKKSEVMEALLRQKFSYPDLQERLLATDDRDLIEGNTWHDNFWGTCGCMGDHCPHSKTPGLNMLGKLLVKIRAELRKSNEDRKAP